jgi:hypothetical protein
LLIILDSKEPFQHAAARSIAPVPRSTAIHTQWIGKIGNSAPDSSQTNLLDFEPITIELAEAGDSLSLASVSSTSEDAAEQAQGCDASRHTLLHLLRSLIRKG